MVVVGDVAAWGWEGLSVHNSLSARIHRVTVPRAAPLVTVGGKEYNHTPLTI